jgi:hypothetical protein
VLVIIVIVYLLASKNSIRNTSWMTSEYDGLKYRVHNAHSGPENAANTIAILNEKAITLLRYLKTGNQINSDKNMVSRLLKNYSTDNLVENSPKNISGDTSFTYNDGSVLALCIREYDPASTGDVDTYDIHDINTLTFVLVHEMAHISIIQSGHPPEFWKSFKKLLLDAQNAGILQIIDYSKYPVKYCGMIIDSNPAV